MAFSADVTLCREVLQVSPLKRLRTIALADYTTASDKDCFILSEAASPTPPHWICSSA